MSGGGRDPGDDAGVDDLEELRDLHDLSPAAVVVTDGLSRVLRVNATFVQMTGRARQEVLGLPVQSVLTPGSGVFYDAQLLPALGVRGRVDGLALDVARADGAVVAVLASAVVVRDAAGGVRRVNLLLLEAAERRRVEAELVAARAAAERSERRLRTLHRAWAALAAAGTAAEVAAATAASAGEVAPAAGAAVWLADPAGTLRLRATVGTPELAPDVLDAGSDLPAALVAATGEARVVGEPEELVARWPAVAARMRSTRVLALVAVPIRSGDDLVGVLGVEFRRMRTFAADELDTLRALADQAGTSVHRAHLQERLRRAALHDPLTDASNRVRFEERLREDLRVAADGGGGVAVLLLDLDDFKAVNDRFGHRGGDHVLRTVTARAREVVGAGDLFARLGGDEFAVVCAPAGQARAVEVAERVVTAVSRPVDVDGMPVAVTCSVGVAVHDPAARDGRPAGDGGLPGADALLHLADVALFAAKSSGKNRYRLHDEALRAETTRREWVEGEVRRALDEDDLVPWYQPVYDLPTGRMVGTEALCRLRSGDRVLLPGEFLDVAIARGLVGRLGQRMLTQACREAVRWASWGRPDLTVSVNVAAEQAVRPEFADGVLRTLGETGCPPDRLQLELTESTLLEAGSGTVANLRRLRAAGVGLALDDFGTQYASLRYVQRFPLTALKIDRSFVSGIPGQRTDTAIVHASITLARSLGLGCVAEGIETAAQRGALTDLGVHGQGFGLARPMPAADLHALLV